jgi:hypothetical protein
MRHTDRRRDARVTAPGLRARVRAGHSLVIVNVSSTGALVEAACQLRPGSRIDVHLETDEYRQVVGAKVTRCAVSAIDAVTGITYRAALNFTEGCDWLRERATHAGSALHENAPGDEAAASVSGDLLPARRRFHAGNATRGSK